MKAVQVNILRKHDVIFQEHLETRLTECFRSQRRNLAGVLRDLISDEAAEWGGHAGISDVQSVTLPPTALSSKLWQVWTRTAEKLSWKYNYHFTVSVWCLGKCVFSCRGVSIHFKLVPCQVLHSKAITYWLLHQMLWSSEGYLWQ